MNKELNDLIETHYKENFVRLSRFYRFRRGVGDGEDLVHDAYVKILEFNVVPRNFDRFFTVVIENTFRNFKRGEKNKREAKKDYRTMFTREAHMDLGPDEIRVLDEVLKLIEKKKGKTYDILFLSFACQLDPADISEIVKTSPEYAKLIIHKFRKKIREKLYNH